MDIARIYVLWHPKFAAGRALAGEIYAWFRPPGGSGLPVFYRCEPLDDAPLPIPIDPAATQLNLIVLLVEEHMVTDAAWRRWLAELAREQAGNPHRTMLYPVALHRTAYNLPTPIRQLNYISLTPAAGRGAEIPQAEMAALSARLLKQLTEAFARVFVRREWGGRSLREADAEPPKVRIFLSHAKADGGEEARILRDYIYRETQLSAFFDENDIALGSRFSQVLEETLQNEAAALIAIQTDAYASRPWCRREVRLFREPRNLGLERIRQALARADRRLPANELPPLRTDIWMVQPVLVVEAMRGNEPSWAIPEFGNSRSLRWREEKKHLYVDSLLRDTILRSYHLRVAESLPSKPGRILVNWAPDPLSVYQLMKNSGDLAEKISSAIKRKRAGEDSAALLQAIRKQRPLARAVDLLSPKVRDAELIYPNGGLSGLDLDAIDDLFPKMKFLTYAEAERLA